MLLFNCSLLMSTRNRWDMKEISSMILISGAQLTLVMDQQDLLVNNITAALVHQIDRQQIRTKAAWSSMQVFPTGIFFFCSMLKTWVIEHRTKKASNTAGLPCYFSFSFSSASLFDSSSSLPLKPTAWRK